MTLSNPIEPAGRGAWTEPGVFPAAPGVHRIPLPMPSDGLQAVNVYAIEDGAITRVLVIHAHRDHYTLAVQLRQDVGARVGLGVGERPNLHAITTRQHGPLGAQARQLRAAGAGNLADTVMAGASQAPPAPGYDQPDDWLEPGAVELPGRAHLPPPPNSARIIPRCCTDPAHSHRCHRICRLREPTGAIPGHDHSPSARDFQGEAASPGRIPVLPGWSTTFR